MKTPLYLFWGSDVPTPSQNQYRVIVFVDYSNFRPSMERTEHGFRIDLRPLGNRLAQAALATVEPDARLIYQGMRLYGSYDPDTPAGETQRNWYTNFASQVPGVYSVLVPRQRKRGYPTCPNPSCHKSVETCPACGSNLRGTEEKGVDTRIATDLISMAWDGNYDVAVLVSSDRDFVPVVRFLQNRAIKVVHGAFPPFAAELSQECWASISVPNLREQFRLA